MLDRPARPFRRAGLVSGPVIRRAACCSCHLPARGAIFEQNAGHDVEAVSLRSLGLRRLGREPCARSVAQASLLARVHGFGRDGVIRSAPRLHLDEDQQRPAPRDQVDLDAIGADVARDDAITSRREMTRSGVFAETPERGAAAGRGIRTGRVDRRSRRRLGVGSRSSGSGQRVRRPRSRSGRIAVARGAGRPG